MNNIGFSRITVLITGEGGDVLRLVEVDGGVVVCQGRVGSRLPVIDSVLM